MILALVKTKVYTQPLNFRSADTGSKTVRKLDRLSSGTTKNAAKMVKKVDF